VPKPAVICLASFPILNEKLEFALIAGVCAGIYLFCHGFRLLQRRRLILNTPFSKIRSASLGLVEVSGLAAGPYTIRAPITAMPCYYHRTVVWQMKQEGKSKEWVKVLDENLHLPFYLDDNTGRVLINPDGAEMDLHRDFCEEYNSSFFSSRPDIPANVLAFLGQHGIADDKQLKVEEYCIKPKNALFVLGTVAENPGVTVDATPVRRVSDAAELHLSVSAMLTGKIGELQSAQLAPPSKPVTVLSSNSDESPEIVRLSPQVAPTTSADMSQQQKIAAAMSKAGITNPAAWAMVGMHPLDSSLNSAGAVAATSAGEFDLHPKTVLMKGDNNPAFFISWRSQRDVAQALGWKSALMIWGGPVLTTICLFILCAGLGWL
jgi:E3 Ubiquitin ligase